MKLESWGLNYRKSGEIWAKHLCSQAAKLHFSFGFVALYQNQSASKATGIGSGMTEDAVFGPPPRKIWER